MDRVQERQVHLAHDWEEVMDDTARLIILENPAIGLKQFRSEFVHIHPNATLEQVTFYYKRYLGFDNRIQPTHDYATGNRI